MAAADAIVGEMRAIVHGAAMPCRPGESVKGAIGRAARQLGLGFRRTRTFWYAAPCSVLAVEADRLRALHAALAAERLRGALNEAALLATEAANDRLVAALRAARALAIAAPGDAGAAGAGGRLAEPLVAAARGSAPGRRRAMVVSRDRASHAEGGDARPGQPPARPGGGGVPRR